MGTTNRRVLLTRPTYTRKPVLSTSGTPSAHADVHAHVTRSTPLVERACVASGTSACAHVRELANQLTPEEKQELLDRLLADKMLSSSGAGDDREVTMWTEAVHRALVAAVGASGGSVAGPGLLRKVLRVGAAWEPVATFMRASKLLDLPVLERQQAYNLVAELLVQYAKVAARRSGAPMSPKLVANCSQNVAGVFDSAFPGYAASGLARMVVRARAA